MDKMLKGVVKKLQKQPQNKDNPKKKRAKTEPPQNGAAMVIAESDGLAATEYGDGDGVVGDGDPNSVEEETREIVYEEGGYAATYGNDQYDPDGDGDGDQNTYGQDYAGDQYGDDAITNYYESDDDYGGYSATRKKRWRE